MSGNESDELQNLCEPVIRYLQDNYDPYVSVIITENIIRLERTEMFIPTKNGD